MIEPTSQEGARQKTRSSSFFDACPKRKLRKVTNTPVRTEQILRVQFVKSLDLIRLEFTPQLQRNINR
jgi:hypothetical protein